MTLTFLLAGSLILAILSLIVADAWESTPMWLDICTVVWYLFVLYWVYRIYKEVR